jgi:hypothetical protein
MAKRFRIEYRLYSPTAPLAYVTAPDDEVGADADSLNLSYKHNGYANYDTAATTTFTIRADFYAFVYYWLWQDAAAISNSVECRIYDYVCEKYLYGEYYIKQGGLQFCKDECTLKVSAKHEDLTYKCLMNTLVDTDQATNPDAVHNWFSGGLLHPEFGYCVNKGFVYLITLFVVAMMLSPGLILIFIVFFAFNLFNTWIERARGCDRKLPSPLITTYLENLTDNCFTGLTDRVFTNPSKLGFLLNACIFFAPVQKGIDLQDNTTLYSLTNALNYSGKQFMEFLQKRFNLKWRVNPTGLIIHHFDESYSPIAMLDLTDVPDVCCEWTGKKPPSYGNYDFTLDQMDAEGNAARRAYNDIVEFNSPYSPAQDGELRRTFGDAAVGFRNDGLRSDDISQHEFWFAPAIILLNVLTSIPNADDFVLTSEYTTSVPKIIIWDGVSSKHNAKAIKKSFSADEIAVLSAEGYDPGSMVSQFGKNTYFYNYVMPCNAELNAFTPNTYPLFECDNVRVCPCRKEQLCKFTIPTCDCDILTVLGIYENTATGAIIDYPVRMDNQTIGEIQGIDIDFGANTIVLTVKPTNCQNEVIIPPPPCDITILTVDSECPGNGGTALVTVTWLAVNTSTNVTVTVGAYSLGVLASSGTATLSVPGDGSTVLVTVFDNNDSNCMEGQSYELPYCCSDGNANMGISCAANCDEYDFYRLRSTVNSGAFDITGVTINGVLYNYSGGTAATPSCTDVGDLLDEFKVAFPTLTFMGKLTDDWFEFVVVAPCCDTTPLVITLHCDDGAPFDEVAAFIATYDCATIQAYIVAENYDIVACAGDGYETGFTCCDDFCFTATNSGSPTAVATDIIEYSYDNITYFTGGFACVDAGNDLYFRRTITYSGGCPDTIITKRIYDITDCSSYSIETL